MSRDVHVFQHTLDIHGCDHGIFRKFFYFSAEIRPADRSARGDIINIIFLKSDPQPVDIPPVADKSDPGFILFRRFPEDHIRSFRVLAYKKVLFHGLIRR